MRVLILGASGMLGHKLWQVCQQRFETWGTTRADGRSYAGYGLYDPERLLGGVDACELDTIVRALVTARPDAVINCIGIIKQRPEANDPVASLAINSVFPHRLVNLCQMAGARLIQISTDCVFSGRKGMYTEGDIPDAEDLYGRSKLLGEVDAPGCLTVRTSFIGRELQTAWGLVEWFLAAADGGGRVPGYTRAIYSGLTSLAMADVIAAVIEHHPALTGVYHVSSEPISKYDLLRRLRQAFEIEIEITPYPDVQVDRSLDSSRFRAATGIVLPTWAEMVHTMAADPTPYDQWHSRK